MRIVELLEGKNFKDLDFVKQDGDKREIDFDLAEDLIYFMNNNDDVYRRHVYPSIAKCVESYKKKKGTKPNIFKSAVLDSYNSYIREFPIRELPQSLDEKLCQEICSKMHEEVCKGIEEGKYKD